MVYIFLYFVGFNWLYFVENFRIYDNGKYWSTVFFLVISLLGFGVRAMMVSKNELKSVLTAFMFLKRLQRIYIIFS